jgi:hypothetical protein
MSTVWLTNWREKESRKENYIEQQLDQLFIPLFARCARLKAKNSQRLRTLESDDSMLGSGFSPNLSEANYEKEVLQSFSELVEFMAEKLWLGDANFRSKYQTALEYLEEVRGEFNFRDSLLVQMETFLDRLIQYAEEEELLLSQRCGRLSKEEAESQGLQQWQRRREAMQLQIRDSPDDDEDETTPSA